MAKIRVDIEALQSNSSQLKSKIDELQALNSRLENLISRIEASWEGDASLTFIRIMIGHMEKARKMIDVLQEYKNYVDKAAQQFADMDKNSASQIRGSF